MSLMRRVKVKKAKHVAKHVAHVKGHKTHIHKAVHPKALHVHLKKGPSLTGHNTHTPAHPKAGYFTVK